MKEAKMTLQDFKQEILAEAEVQSPNEFCMLSAEHHRYWQSLNEIGLRGIDPKNPPLNPDARVELTEMQTSVLRVSFMRLKLFGRH